MEGGGQSFSFALEYKVRCQKIKWKEHIVLEINITQPCEKSSAGRILESISS